MSNFDHPDMGRYIGRFYGKYRGRVTSNEDPKKLGRIMIHIPYIHLKDIETGEKPSTGWAWPMSAKPIMRIPKVGAVVWVEFEQGITEKPMWSPGPHALFDGVSDADNHSKGKYDTVDNSGGKSDGAMPTSQFEGDYGQVESWKAGGNLIEIDSSEGKERILISHVSGTTIEIQADGTVHNYTSGNSKEVIRGGTTSQVEGAVNKTVRGPTNETYNGSQKVTNNKGKESIVIGGTKYTYDKLEENSKSKIIKITGKHELAVGGSSSQIITGKQSSIIMENSSTIVNNVLGIANPLSTAINMHAVAGEIELKAGLTTALPGVDHSRLIVGPFRTQLLGKVVQLGGSDVLAIHPATRSDLLVAYLAAVSAALITAGTAITTAGTAITTAAANPEYLPILGPLAPAGVALASTGVALASIGPLAAQLPLIPSPQVLIS